MSRPSRRGKGRGRKDLQEVQNPVALPVAPENPKALPADTILARLIEAWPTLPESTKVGILAMVRATSGNGPKGEDT